MRKEKVNVTYDDIVDAIKRVEKAGFKTDFKTDIIISTPKGKNPFFDALFSGVNEKKPKEKVEFT